MKKKAFFILFFLLCGCSLFAQTSGRAGKVFVDLNTGISIADNSFTNTWQPQSVLHLNIRLPFFTGQMEGGVRYIRFAGRAPTSTNSDFHSIFIHLGYSYPIQLTSHFQLGPTLRFGNNLMLFDQTETYKSKSFRYVTDPVESEFAYELALRNQLQLSRHWFIHATLSYNRTLTRFPLPLTLISAGITYAFPQPNWLKNFIR